MLTRIHHVGVVVPSLEEGLRFWRDTLGMRLTKSATIEEQGVVQLSPMPANLAGQIDEADFYHLLAYLLSTTDLDDASLVAKARQSPGLVGREQFGVPGECGPVVLGVMHLDARRVPQG